MSLVDLIIDLDKAKTPEEEKQAYTAFDARNAAQPSDSEVLTSFLRDCTNLDGTPILKPDEVACLDGNKIVTQKLN